MANKGLKAGHAKECLRILGKMVGNKTKSLAELFWSSRVNIDLYIINKSFRIEGAHWQTPLKRIPGVSNKCFPSGQLVVRETKGEPTVDMEYISQQGSFNYTVPRKFFKQLIKDEHITFKDTCTHG